MNTGLAWLVLALSAGLTAGYTDRVLARSIGIEALNAQRGMFRSVVGAIGFVALVGAFIWGFVHLTWWWVVLAFLGVSLLVVPLVFGGRSRIPLMYMLQPLFGIVCIGIVIYLWVWF